MELQSSDLPKDVEALRALVLEQASILQSKDLEIEKLRLQLATLRRMRFGQSSEKLDRQIEQLELTLEEMEASSTTPAMGPVPSHPESEAPKRRPLPDHLPREEIVLDPGTECPACGGRPSQTG